MQYKYSDHNLFPRNGLGIVYVPYVAGANSVTLTCWQDDVYSINGGYIYLSFELYDNLGNNVTRTVKSQLTVPYDPMLSKATGDLSYPDVFSEENPRPALAVLGAKDSSKSGNVWGVEGYGKCLTYIATKKLNSTLVDKLSPDAEHVYFGLLCDYNETDMKFRDVNCEYNYMFGGTAGSVNNLIEPHKVTSKSNNATWTPGNIDTKYGKFRIKHRGTGGTHYVVNNFKEGNLRFSGVNGSKYNPKITTAFAIADNGTNRKIIAEALLDEYFSH